MHAGVDVGWEGALSPARAADSALRAADDAWPWASRIAVGVRNTTSNHVVR